MKIAWSHFSVEAFASNACYPGALHRRRYNPSRSLKRFLVHHVWHLGRIAAVVAFENVDESLHTASSHAFIWIDIETRDLRATGEMMEEAATVNDVRIKQW